MNALKDGGILISLAVMASFTLAATPPPGATSGAPDGYATMAKSIGQEKVNAKAQENERMSRCEAMEGDEKKACEQYARLAAKDAVKSGPLGGGDVKSKK